MTEYSSLCGTAGEAEVRGSARLAQPLLQTRCWRLPSCGPQAADSAQTPTRRLLRGATRNPDPLHAPPTPACSFAPLGASCRCGPSPQAPPPLSGRQPDGKRQPERVVWHRVDLCKRGWGNLLPGGTSAARNCHTCQSQRPMTGGGGPRWNRTDRLSPSPYTHLAAWCATNRRFNLCHGKIRVCSVQVTM
jgi:hypothetical protein